MLVNTKSDEDEKKSTGRPLGSGIHGRPFQMRLNEAFLAAIDDWRVTQRPVPSRAESIRRLVEEGLKALKRGK